MKATTISFNRAILPYACTLLLGACGPGQKQEEKKKQPEEKGAPSAAVAVDCSAGNIYEDRKKHYGDTKLGDLVTKFHDHFRLRAGGAKIMNTPLAIPWKAFDDARKVVESDIHPIAGIYFNYGIDGNKFQPVVDFMYQKTVGSDLKVLPDASFEFDGAKLVSIDEKRRIALIDAYANGVEVNRVGDGYTTLRIRPTNPDPTVQYDPTAIWYQYANELNNLIQQNQANPQTVVLTCMSQLLCYDQLQPFVPVPPEFRHMLTLHIDGRLNDDAQDPSNLFAYKAMDLGHLCPPRCK